MTSTCTISMQFKVYHHNIVNLPVRSKAYTYLCVDYHVCLTDISIAGLDWMP